MYLLSCLLAVSVMSGTGPDHERSGPIGIVVNDTTVSYTRPDSASTLFAHLFPGDTLTVSVKSSSGWLGFDPGVAQAGNVGIFRYRWVPPDGGFELLGDSVALSPSWTPRAGVPYAMALEDTPVLSEPDSLSAVTDTLPAGSAAAIIEHADDWYRVDLRQGPLERCTLGWVDSQGVSVSEDPAPVVYP